jgi:hypothetical protein
MTRCEYCDSALVIEDDSNADDMDLDGAEEAGYRFEKGRQRARDEQKRVVNLDTTSGMSEDHLIRAAQYDHKTYTNAAPPKRKKKHTLWWVLGWIFIFPIPATILAWRSRKLSMPVKITIIVLCWLLYMGIGAAGSEEESTSSQESQKNTGSANVQEEKEDSEPASAASPEETVTLFDIPEGFTEGYEKADYDKFNSYASENGLADTKIWIEGRVEELVDIKIDSDDSEQVAYYYVIKQSDNKKWLAPVGIDGYISQEELKARTGDTIVLNGLYQGFSDKFHMPSLNGVTVFDRSKGDRFSTWLYPAQDGTYEFANCIFSVPEDWRFKKPFNENRYFYPENGMLMVSKITVEDEVSKVALNNEKFLDSFFEGYKKNFKEIESIEKESIEVDGTFGAIYEVFGTLDASEAQPGQNLVVVFPTRNALTVFSFMESDNEGTYMEDFKKVIESIHITNRADL